MKIVTALVLAFIAMQFTACRSPLSAVVPTIASLQVTWDKESYPKGTKQDNYAEVECYGKDSTVWAGTVSVNDSALYTLSEDGTTRYSNVSAKGVILFPFKNDGSNVVFKIQGNNNFPAITDSIVGMSADLTISQPSPTSVISRSKGLTITWNKVGAEITHVYITDNNPSHQAFSRETGDGGSELVTPGDLSGLAPGPIVVSVTVVNQKVVPRLDGTSYRMIILASHEVNTILAP